MNSACIRVLPRPPYYGHLISSALKDMGYRIVSTPEQKPKEGDLLVLWNRYPRDERFTQLYEAAGARIIVVENGYFGRNFRGEEWFAVALGQHNGAGSWPEPDRHRWNSLGVETSGEWQNKTNGEIVLLATRGMGSDITREPSGWLRRVEASLRRKTGRTIRVRPHPGPQGAIPKVSLEDDLRNAWAAVTWASSAGLKAIAMGIPVFYGLPKWIGGKAAHPITHDIEDRFLGNPMPMFYGVASAMWSLAEIKSGKAFRCLLT